VLAKIVFDWLYSSSLAWFLFVLSIATFAGSLTRFLGFWFGFRHITLMNATRAYG